MMRKWGKKRVDKEEEKIRGRTKGNKKWEAQATYDLYEADGKSSQIGFKTQKTSFERVGSPVANTQGEEIVKMADHFLSNGSSVGLAKY